MARFKGVRARAALLATGVLAMALVLAGVILSRVVETNLLANLETTLQQQANDRLQLLGEGADPKALTSLASSEAFVVINRGSESITAGVGGWVGCASYPCTLDVQLFEEGEGEEEELHRVLAVTAVGDTSSVVIGSELEQVTATVDRVRWALAIGILFLVALIGYIIWRTVGRVLAPVEAIRQTAEATHGSSLDNRVERTGTNDEIDRLAGTVNEMLDRIAGDAETRRQFASDASHELKSPLANLRAMIDTTPAEEWSTVSRSAAAEVDRMGALVDDLLFLTVSDEGHHSRPERVHLDDVLFDEIEVLAAGTDLRIDGSGVVPGQVMGDRRQLRRAVRNLLSNALRHAQSTVRVALETDGQSVVVVVDDDGPGVPEEARQRIFERFVRVDNARARATGSTGLGLAIVAEIAHRHDGSACVTDAEIGGARFELRLPTG